MGRLRLPPGWRAWPLVLAALVLLNVSLTFGNVWPTPKVQLQPLVSVELAACVLALALLGGRARTSVARGLALLWLILIVGRYLDVTAPALYGRPFSLYWDSPHLRNVAAMLTASVPVPWLLLGGIGIAVAIAVLFVLLRAALGVIADAAARRGLRLALSAVAATTLAGFAAAELSKGDAGPRGETVFAAPVTPTYARQLRSVMAMLGPGAAAPVLGASPAALSAVPRGLRGADVHLLFVESYGAVAFESPELRETLAASRAALTAAAQDTGRHVVSAFVESPTFGGSSWLAHLTLLSGIDVRDQYSYQALMTQQRPTLVSTFARAGYRTVALMPGTRKAWPEGAFYHYDTIYDHAAFEYRGPAFGWWDIPDQFTLAKLDAVEGPPASRAPLFVVFPTSTTHAPFGPVPPYQPVWAKVLASDAYDPAEVARILADPPDLTHMSAGYGRAMSYEFTTFAGYLRERAGEDLVSILVGDHQPAAAVAGRNATWTVPVHVIASDQGIVRRLLASGFRTGLEPSRPALGKMHELVPMLLGAFGATP